MSVDVRTALLVIALVSPSVACVTGDVPPRPAVALTCADGGAPTELASAPGCGSMRLVVANDYVYWTEKATGTLKKVPACGGAITTIATGLTSPGPLAVDATSVFWVNGDKTLMKKALAGNAAATTFVAATTETEVLGGENNINALLIDQGLLYFGRYIYAIKVPTDGSVPPKVISFSPEADLGQPGAFAIDATHLYQTEIGHLAISREKLDGTQNGLLKDGITHQHFAPDRIAVSQDGLVLDAIAVANGQVIWAKSNVINAKPVDALEGDSFVSIARTSTFPSITGFVVNGDQIYLGGDRSVEKVPLSTAIPFPTDSGDDIPQPTTVATGQMSPGQFAADANAIYWRTADCKIMRLAK